MPFQWIHDSTDSENENGLFEEGYIVPKSHANYLYKTSCLTALSVAYACKQGHYSLTCVPLSVLCSSLLHWSYPTQSWRRYLDISVVWASLTYQLYRSQTASYKTPYYITVSFGAVFYPLAFYFQRKRHQVLATFSHSLLHIIGNISNFVLYSGTI